MRFSRIRLENWRNFTSVDVALQNRVFLVGPNASGKSNFLDVFRFLRDIARPGGGLQEAIALRRGISQLRSLSAPKQSQHILIDIELAEDDETKWRYQLKFDKGRHPRTSLVVEERVWKQGTLLFERPDQADRSDPERLTQTVLEQTFANQQFREIVEFFRAVNYLHIVPQLVREPERFKPQSLDPYGSDLLEQMGATDAHVRQAVLNRLQKVLSRVTLPIAEMRLERDRVGKTHLLAKVENWRDQHVWQDETEFSDGTLRLIGLLWALQVGRGPVLLEEPELSLHTGVVQQLVPLIWNLQRQQKKAERQQILLTTHSTELLSDPGIQGDELLLLIPSSTPTEGTSVIVGAERDRIRVALDVGLPAGQVAASETEPENLTQIILS